MDGRTRSTTTGTGRCTVRGHSVASAVRVLGPSPVALGGYGLVSLQKIVRRQRMWAAGGMRLRVDTTIVYCRVCIDGHHCSAE